MACLHRFLGHIKRWDVHAVNDYPHAWEAIKLGCLFHADIVGLQILTLACVIEAGKVLAYRQAGVLKLPVALDRIVLHDTEFCDLLL